MFEKPHRSHADLVQILVERGLTCSDPAAAESRMSAVGYYRLSAYVYPFRVLLPESEQRVTSPVHYRSDQITPGTSFEHVEGLWQFDRKLRLLCLDAIETVEIGLRAHLAHVLAARDVFGHVHRESLEEAACSAPADRKNPDGPDNFQDWQERYEALQRKAQSEDFVVHHLYRHGAPLPIWIAVEILDMGALVRLYKMLDKRDQNAVAKGFGVAGGPLLGRWLTQLNYVRNVCAHHSRLWNRSLTYSTPKFNPAQVDERLKHAATCGERDKVYLVLAILAYLVRQADSGSNWPLTLRTLGKKFPDLPGITIERDMGFPPGWAELPLWSDQKGS